MNQCNKNGNSHILYLIVKSRESLNQREKGLLKLEHLFDKIVLIAKEGNRMDEKNIVVHPYPNPFGLLRVAGLNNFKTFIERYFLFPSRNIFFVIPAIRKLKEIVSGDLANGRKVTILSCLPPHDFAIIGLSIKKKYPGIRWVVDWQDLWSYDEYYYMRVPKLYRELLRVIEKSILFSCDVNVTTNPKAKRVLKDYFNVPGDKVVAIHHHYNEDDIYTHTKDRRTARAACLDDMLNIGFLGNLFKYPKVDGERIVDTVQAISVGGLPIKLHIFGDRSKYAKAAARSQKGRILLYEPTSHAESLRRISKCNFLLLVLSESENCNIIMNIKLPFYISLDLPIIAIVPENSSVADIIRETGTGYVIPSAEDWKVGLKRVLVNHMEGTNIPTRNLLAIHSYSWEKISPQWASVLVNPQRQSSDLSLTKY